MTPLDPDEAAFRSAVAALDIDSMADSAVVAHEALRAGSRIRRRRMTTGWSCAAVLSVGLGGSLWGIAHDRAAHGTAHEITTRPTHGAQSLKPQRHHAPHRQHSQHKPPKVQPIPASSLADAYAVLEAPGWVPPAPQSFLADEKLYYAHGIDAGVVLSWRTPGDHSTFGQVIGSATIDGDTAEIHRAPPLGIVTIVGPTKDGRFLTLQGTPGVDVARMRELAAHVRRQ